VLADNNMLESVCRNLISNAIKFTPKGGQIEIKASESGLNTILIAVKDDGIGMSRDILDKLFSLSAKINRKGTEGELSSGLGLILCKELIEKQGGKVWAESEENKGSTFYFTLKTTVNVP
jgi:signal transduction histidine kinase